MKVKVKLLKDGAIVPQYMTDSSSGMDLFAAVEEPVILNPGEFLTVPTGIAVEIPSGYEGQIRARSGIASLLGVGVLNGPGTIDADYRGEVKVILFNFGKKPFVIEPGARIAQLVIAPVVKAEVEIVDELSKTSRGEKGFGHSGFGLSQDR